MLPILKYRCLCGNRIEAFKLVHNYYDLEAAVNLIFKYMQYDNRKHV